MGRRVHLAVDSRGRVSVQKLGFAPSSIIVAEPNVDGSVVLRRGNVLTDAEVESLSRGIEDLQNGRVEPGRRTG